MEEAYELFLSTLEFDEDKDRVELIDGWVHVYKWAGSYNVDGHRELFDNVQDNG